jgi:hypothetical protein
MSFHRTAQTLAWAISLLLLTQGSNAQTGSTLAVETGNNTAACSGPNDPLGKQPYCSGYLIGFPTYSGNTNAQTQLVDAVPGHMSSLPLNTWLNGATTKFIAPYQPWFCTAGKPGPYNGIQKCTTMNSGGHSIVGYNENSAPVVAAQHDQMINLGYWAVSPDWDGTSIAQSFQNTTVATEATDLAGRSGYPLKLLIMIDEKVLQYGATLPRNEPICPQDHNDETNCIINSLKADTDYIDQQWAENPYYARDSATSANLVSVFINECDWPSVQADCPQNVGPTNWDTIWETVTQYVNATYKTPMEFIKQYGSFTTNSDPNPFTTSYFSGAYAWPQVAGPNSSQQYYVNGSNGGWTFAAIPSVPGDCSTGPNVPGCMQFYWNQTAPPTGNGSYQYLLDFYTQANNNPSKLAFGELFKGFDWSNASWNTAAKIIAQQCGLILVHSASYTNSAQSPVLYVQTPTWNDYEEGTEVETGVDNCWRVQNASYNQTQDTLTWQLNAVSGQQNFASESTVYGFTVWAATPSGVIQKVASLHPTDRSLSNVSTLVPIDTNFTQLYVEMVGMPLILNQMSNGTTYP